MSWSKVSHLWLRINKMVSFERKLHVLTCVSLLLYKSQFMSQSRVTVTKDDYYDKFRWYIHCLKIYYTFLYKGVWKVLNHVFN